ncbi:hypothetical protein B0H13DRAFT_1904760 [Mycena leptocephala]|nr:hypothetical protein B0H13DRAFT_1904760 [Mycena leptocephala]
MGNTRTVQMNNVSRAGGQNRFAADGLLAMERRTRDVKFKVNRIDRSVAEDHNKKRRGGVTRKRNQRKFKPGIGKTGDEDGARVIKHPFLSLNAVAQIGNGHGNKGSGCVAEGCFGCHGLETGCLHTSTYSNLPDSNMAYLDVVDLGSVPSERTAQISLCRYSAWRVRQKSSATGGGRVFRRAGNRGGSNLIKILRSVADMLDWMNAGQTINEGGRQ